MKTLLAFIALTTTFQASAATIPSILPDGEYNYSCQSIEVRNMEGSGMVRTAIFTTGKAVVITNGNTTITKETAIDRDQEGNILGETEVVSNSKVKELARDIYEVIGTENFSWKGNSKEDLAENKYEAQSKWTRVVKVNGNFEINLNVELNGKPVAPGKGEFFTTKLDDNTYFVSSYVRESFHRPREKNDNSAELPAGTFFHTHSQCQYKTVDSILKF